MAEPNQPSELAPIQARGRQPSQDQTPADDAVSPTSSESPSPIGGGVRANLTEVAHELTAIGQPEFGDAISAPASKSELLTSPEQAQAQAREAADRMEAFRGLSRELTEEEWNSGGTRKLVLERMARLESELIELKKYRSQYYQKDKESAILRQQLQQLNTADKLFDFCLGAGGILIGLATFLFDKSHPVLAAVVLLIGIILLVWPLRLKHGQKA